MITGTHSAAFQGLSQTVQQSVIDQVALAISNVFAIILAGSALAFISSLFLGVSSLGHLFLVLPVLVWLIYILASQTLLKGESWEVTSRTILFGCDGA